MLRGRREIPMIDHVSLAVRDLARSAAFWEPVLEPLGLARLVVRERTIGFGRKYPEFWLNARPHMPDIPADTGIHVALRAPSEAAVALFHARALAAGGADAGGPGPRQAAQTTYFGAFIRDPDGNKVEAVCFPRTDAAAG
jgi:catechol 2,3-dioxygenase-like lactoylglutathione lyase family enzyme